jgi:nucleoside-triphosphatase THEP1
MQLAWQSTMLIVGSSGKGKSTLCRKIIKDRNAIFNVNSQPVLWCYESIESIPAELHHAKDVILHHGIPDMDEIKKHMDRKLLIVLDDLQTQMKNSVFLEKLCTVVCHHYDCQLIILLHTVYYGPTIRNLRLQASYIILFKNNNDKMSVRCLGNQLMPEDSKTFLAIYNEATKEPYSYLLIDLYKACPDELRFRSNVLPREVTYVYVPNKKY